LIEQNTVTEVYLGSGKSKNQLIDDVWISGPFKGIVLIKLFFSFPNRTSLLFNKQIINLSK